MQELPQERNSRRSLMELNLTPPLFCCSLNQSLAGQFPRKQNPHLTALLKTLQWILSVLRLGQGSYDLVTGPDVVQVSD